MKETKHCDELPEHNVGSIVHAGLDATHLGKEDLQPWTGLWELV